MRASPSAIALVAALVGSTATAAEPVWFADIRGTGSVAKWGFRESDAVGFWVGCERGLVVLSPELYALQEPSDALTIRFSVDGEAYDRRADLAFDDVIKAWHARARVEGDDALITAMRRGSELTYDFDPPLRAGDAFTVSLSGSAKAIDAVLEEC